MTQPFKSLAELDRLIHDPSRLAILTALSSCRSADFLYLQRLTGLSKGNLSSHLTKLEEAGLVAVEKGYVAKTPMTKLTLTKEGRSGIERHWKQLDKLRAAALKWQPEG
jgi:DNA-binding MarR family transcriptional regulator